MIGAMTRPVPLAARLLLGAAAALALCQAIAATGLCAGPLALLREAAQDPGLAGAGFAGLLPLSAAAHLLWPLAGPAAAFAEAFPAAPPDLPTAVALSSHHAQVPRSGIPSLDAAWMVLAALRLRREGKGARTAAWTCVALAFIYLLGSGREPLVALAAAVPLAVAAEAFFTWTAPAPRRVAVAGCTALAMAWTGALAAARSGATGLTGALSGVLLAASALVPILLAVRLPRDAAPGRPTARPAAPRDPLAVALSCVFFLSGAAGLFYEVIFAKSLALTFGSTANASTAVLAIYMAGMALG